MFNKVLIAEDQQSANISVRKTLEELGIAYFKYVYYCDDALLYIKNALSENEPFELLITDLVFEPDERPQKLASGEALITAARQVQPDLRILVFSTEQRVSVIEALKNGQGINGYVRKARRDAEELQLAIASIYKNKMHFPVNLREAVQQKNAHDFSKFDVIIIRLLAQGMLQKDIPAYLVERQIKPSGLSSLEKRLNLIREAYEFSNNEQLIAFCKDIGII
jgi:two-component system capsular synthesis response regulator RcsB